MDKHLPKVTIITTTFNLSSDSREDFFEKCCESVHNQTYKNIEHIVQDGASNDETIALVKKYEDKGWLKFYSEPDKGIDDGYNHAISHATGKYVFFMNSDDQYYANDVIEKCVELMEQENADYCYGSERQYDRKGKYIRECKPNLSLFWHNVPYPHATLGIKKDVLEKLGNYNIDCGYGGDYYLMIQLILNDYKGVEAPFIISKYILGGISSQNENKAKRWETWFILAKRLKYIFEQFYPEITLEDCFNIHIFTPNNTEIFPKDFLLKLIKFMLDKHLKNYDYNAFINYVNSLSCKKTMNMNVTIRFLGFIPIIKIKKTTNKKTYKLFGLIPILTIKERTTK